MIAPHLSCSRRHTSQPSNYNTVSESCMKNSSKLISLSLYKSAPMEGIIRHSVILVLLVYVIFYSSSRKTLQRLENRPRFTKETIISNNGE